MAECTIYDKLRYIAETKDLIKAAIEAQDVKVLESATFRQYAEYITEIRKVSSVNGMQGDVTITAADLGALTEIPSEYITETELNEKGYLTAVPDVYITEDELSSQLADKVSQNGLNEAIASVRNDIPTNVSELTNDSGYITLNEVPKVDLSGYALKSEIPDISVKQDKLTAGNGISITDNVISLDYEYDLFEVVQSLPTENISDNKVYLLLDSNGSEGNTYVEYLYVNGQWEELGKFKVNIDLSGYATEQWVNEQGFLKEHQDISNLATKAELNTKQDTITDLETIRSGASKGATALQSVPSTYALKSDILSAKTDTRYTTYEVQNPVLSGKTILLQNEVTDSRKYHTFGFDKTYSTTTSNGLLTFSTPLYRDSNEYNCPQWDGNSIRFTYQSGNEVWVKLSIPYTYNGIKYVTHLVITVYNDSVRMWYSDYISDGISSDYQVVEFKESEIYKYFRANGTLGIYVNGVMKDYDSEPNSPTNFGSDVMPGETVEITVRNFPLIVQTGVFEIETPRFYISYNNVLTGDVPTKEDTSNAPERLNDYIRYANNVKAYILTDKNTTFKTINGQQITGNGDITIDTNVDLSGYATEQWVNSQGFLKEHQNISNLATKAELNTKQDTITDLETIRSGAALGATALQSVPDTYALKTDILSAKTDTRYTDYDVQNPLLSGNTIVLQNEVTDSRKYHTLGFDKIATTIGFGNLTKRVVMNSDGSVTSDFDDYTNIPIDFSNITDDGDVIIINYVGTYANHNDDGTTYEGDAFNEYITYNKQTKILKYSERQPSFAFAQFSRSDNGENVLFPNSSEYDCSQLPEDAHLIWNIYVSSSFFYTYTAETQGNLFVGETTVNANTSSMPDRKNEYFRYENDVKAYILTDKNTTFKTINGEQITGDGDITIDTNVDLTPYATKEELNTKQDTITDLEAIRSGAAKGATALQSVPEEYAKKTDIPDISTKQDVISDLETIRSGAALGATALQSVPSGYATEQWVNEQGFIKEHQDISNLATKSELATKQDVITDLDSIRSGAALGSTALQSVPNTYALKSEIPDISVKQDKLTAGNGISITDNVISLDYEYDLFEVVPSLPTENISDNKIYLVYQSDGDGNNLYIEYIYAAGHWEELGKFKANVDLSGYATEQWVNSQGFLKEHQDISNLATKSELNAKQDAISDLDTIRNGASKGATALQSVPEEYAKKTDIPDISTKQDVISDLETIRSGAALGATALQTVPTGYATEKWVNEQGFIKEHQDISNLATKEELNTKQDVITDLGSIRSGAAKGETALQSVPSGYATEQWVNEQGFLKEHQDISNLATKQELATKQDVITDLDSIRSGAEKGATALQSVPSEYVTETELNNKGYLTSVPDTYALKSEIPDISVKQDTLVSGTNIKTINGTSLLGAGNIEVAANVDLSSYATKEELNAKQDTLVSGTNIKTINGTSLLGAGDITIEGGSGNVDLTDYYTKTETNALVNPKLEQVTLTQAEYDALQTKQDNVLYIISDAEDLKFKTINGQQITGEGNIEIKASADNVPTVQTTPNGTTSNYIYSTISYTNPQYSVISDISNFITYSTDKASIATYKQYWGEKSSNSHQNWSINAATTSQAGLMSASDKTKLDGIDLTTKQDTLVSGTNIKTVNGISLLGEGNITISGEGGADLSGYYTKAEIDAMIGGASTTITQINNLVG